MPHLGPPERVPADRRHLPPIAHPNARPRPTTGHQTQPGVLRSGFELRHEGLEEIPGHGRYRRELLRSGVLPPRPEWHPPGRHTQPHRRLVRRMPGDQLPSRRGRREDGAVSPLAWVGRRVGLLWHRCPSRAVCELHGPAKAVRSFETVNVDTARRKDPEAAARDDELRAFPLPERPTPVSSLPQQSSKPSWRSVYPGYPSRTPSLQTPSRSTSNRRPASASRYAGRPSTSRRPPSSPPWTAKSPRQVSPDA